MRIDASGIAVRGAAAPRSAPLTARLGPLTGRLVSLGWMLSLALALATGATPPLGARLLALAGVLWGIAWGRLDWSRQARWSAEALAVVAALQAVAAMVALDADARVTWPFLAIVAALGPRLLRRPAQVAVHRGALALAPLAVALLAPGRSPEATADAMVAAVAVLVISMLVARRVRHQDAERSLGDVHKLHAQLAERVAADPERFALLVMDPSLAGTLEGDEFVIRHADGERSIVAAELDGDAARMLARRLEQALADMHRAPVGELNTSIGVAVYPDDGRTAGELLEHLDEHLRAARAARSPLHATAEQTPA